MRGYIPTWRSLCDEWMQGRLEEREGAETPVHVLYNAYLEDNPQQYLDIAQFGKVLKSRFQNRKCRRGKQGAQIYVYKNVAIKPKVDKPEDLWITAKTSEILRTQIPILNPSNLLSTSSQTPTASWHQVTAEVVPSRSLLTCDESPLDLRLQSAINRASPLTEDFSSMKEKSPSHFPTNESSTESVESIAPSHHERRADDTESVYSSLSEASSIYKRKCIDGKRFQQTVDIDNSVTSKSCSENSDYSEIQEESSVSAMLVDSNMEVNCWKRDANTPESSLLMQLDIKDIEVEEESCLYLDHHQPIAASDDYKPSILDYNMNACENGNNLLEEKEISDLNIGPTGNEVVNRMAIGRRWVDDNLRDQPGKRAFAQDILAAYKRDHPNDPLSETNLNVLIRSKFPSRRKRTTKGSTVRYFYQNLELREPPETGGALETIEGSCNTPTVLTSAENGTPVAVLNPPANTVFQMNGISYVTLRMSTSSPELGLDHSTESATKYMVMPRRENEKDSVEVLRSDSSEQSLQEEQQCHEFSSQENPNKVLACEEIPANSSRPSFNSSAPEKEMSPKHLEKQKDSVEAFMNIEAIKSEAPFTDFSLHSPQGSSSSRVVVMDMGVSDYINSEMLNEGNNADAEKGKYSQEEENDSEGGDTLTIQYFDAELGIFKDFIDTNLNKESNVIRDKEAENEEQQLEKIKTDLPVKSAVHRVHRKRKKRTKRKSFVQNSAIQKVVMSIMRAVLHSFSAEGCRLPQQERTRLIEAAMYKNNPAVLYKKKDNSSRLLCEASPTLLNLAEGLSYSEVTSLLQHSQLCVGFGCSYHYNLCLLIRAAYVHTKIFGHQCQVRKVFTELLSVHAKSCETEECLLDLCIFSKKELGLYNAEEEFAISECDVPREDIHSQDSESVESTALKLTGSFLAASITPSFTKPILDALQVTASLIGSYTNAAQ